LVTGWSIDSRTVGPGDVFIALKGEVHDGHAFVRTAFDRGAAAAIISDPVGASGTIFRVDDTVAALQQLGQWARKRWAKPIVAVTGSAGKTTTKDVIAELLDVKLNVAKTVGNLNNHLGLPLSLLRFSDTAQIGVIELGMNHKGEIRSLAALAAPQVGVVTNVGYAHIENFASIDDIALAKRELIESLPPDGTAVLNADDPRAASFKNIHSGRTITFGMAEGADIRAESVILGSDGIEFDVTGTHFHSSLEGRHNVANILAGIAVAGLFEIKLSDLVEPIAQLRPGRMRGERHTWRGVTVLNDCYNSNPDAARYMIDVLMQETATRRVAVLGEMLELGSWAEILHRRTGSYAAQAKVDVIVGIRGAARFLVDAAREAGMPGDRAFYFDEPEGAGLFLRDFAAPGDAILFKGSRGTHVERALAIMES
jgi:UDP-N-acetylmuramoyl-tripeptide--D-alanyl-D-alanine ligase